MWKYILIIFVISTNYFPSFSQEEKKNKFIQITDSDSNPIPFIEVEWMNQQKTTFITADDNGLIPVQLSKQETYHLKIQQIGYETLDIPVQLDKFKNDTLYITLQVKGESLDEVVITGNLRPTMRSQSPVQIEVYNHTFFKSNPQPTLFESLESINGVRPQVNCNVCNTGDIHINGLEGPYTMVLIDGMPIVSGLSSVYGLYGIPTSLIQRVEIMKGPASTLYGSEAIGGIINVITKSIEYAPIFSADIRGTTWNEWNMDVSSKFSPLKNMESLVGVNTYWYNLPKDLNNDNFTDVTIQKRISVFNKWQFHRKSKKEFSTIFRYIYEDRWGGEMNWEKKHKGSSDVYGETIETKRFEWMSQYELPFINKTFLTASFNSHLQDSYYGTLHFKAKQTIFFTQLTHYWDMRNHQILLGGTYRYTFYDDNTIATANVEGGNTPQKIHLPGLFVQDEWKINIRHIILTGIRYDYNSMHGSILTPRINYKWQSLDQKNTIRMSIGNGYRVAYIFTEDHAALTGSRDVIIANELKPETSWNADIRYEKKIMTESGNYFAIDFGGFYTYFHNRIIPDYDTHPNKIIYDNLDGFGISRGVSLNVDMFLFQSMRVNAGWTFMDVFTKENNTKTYPYFTEKFSASWNINYQFKQHPISIDYTGNLYSQMQLPLLNELDPRRPTSPWFSIQNVQLTYKLWNKWELYGGVKNILNWTPEKGNPFLIARSHDPFDKLVEYDIDGQPKVSMENPYGLTFDPTYVYASNQGRRYFFGFRYTF